MMWRAFVICLASGSVFVAPVWAQAWNSPRARELVAEGIARRAAHQASGLRSYRARAHGFVFFLAQLGTEGLTAPPVLVKSDQLELEVYWRAPGASKQRIIGWRDRVDLPTEIRYHRDHLGIVQNGFADRIRLGEGDEVRDVPHPLSSDGPSLYDYAIVDSLVISLPGQRVRAIAVAFRPKQFAAPRIVGSMYLDAESGQLVQLRFNFTRAAYLDPSLEDITILLENALWQGRWWLPLRQEIEIRRRTQWLDLPARGIIRGRWVIDGYTFEPELPDRLFRGREIVVAPRAERDTFPWPVSLDEAIGETVGPVATRELAAVRDEVRAVVGGRLLTGLPTAGVTAGSISDLLHVNRVEGLAAGAGVMIRPGAGPTTFRTWAGYGFSDRRLKLRAEVRRHFRWGALTLRAARVVTDIGDDPPASRLVNSLVAQEAGTDYGDYVLAERLDLEGERGAVRASIGVERTTSVAARAAPARGTFAPNPPLGAGTLAVARVEGVARGGGIGDASRYRVKVGVEAGTGSDRTYARARIAAEAKRELGLGALRFDGWAGWGSPDLPAYRSFVLGGRTTLVGEPHRAFGGRAAGVARVGWEIPVPFPALSIGTFASTGRQLVVAPYVAIGVAGRPVAGVPWGASDGPRPVLGISVEGFHRLLRIEAGWSPRRGSAGMTVDLRRTLWPIL